MASRAPLSVGFLAGVLECIAVASSRGLPDPGIKSASLRFPAVAVSRIYRQLHLGNPRGFLSGLNEMIPR